MADSFLPEVVDDGAESSTSLSTSQKSSNTTPREASIDDLSQITPTVNEAKTIIIGV